MNDSADDLAAFLMHRSAAFNLSEQDRLAIYVLVDAYQERDDPPRVLEALRAAASRFNAHPDYRREWAPLTDNHHVTIIEILERLQATERRLQPIRQVEAGVLNIAYYEAGPRGGPVVILLHGFPYDIHSFTDVIPRLVQAGRRVIVPYLRGFGPTRFLSDTTPRFGQQAALGADVIALMNALDIPTAVLAGFGWGGTAACVAAALWPQRCAGLVTVNGYLIQDVSAAMVPIRPDLEAGLWYFYYFLTERGRAGLTANRDDIAQVIWTRNSPNWHYGRTTFRRSATPSPIPTSSRWSCTPTATVSARRPATPPTRRSRPTSPSCHRSASPQ